MCALYPHVFKIVVSTVYSTWLFPYAFLFKSLFPSFSSSSSSYLFSYLFIFVSLQKFPNEGLASVVSNVFDFDSYNKDMREVLYEVLHKHGIPVGAKPTSVKLAKE